MRMNVRTKYEVTLSLCNHSPRTSVTARLMHNTAAACAIGKLSDRHFLSTTWAFSTPPVAWERVTCNPAVSSNYGQARRECLWRVNSCRMLRIGGPRR
jgi:hypothetical protein